MDKIGWFIATLHQLSGHDTAAAFLGQSAGDKAACVVCQYEQQPTSERRAAVIEALARHG